MPPREPAPRRTAQRGPRAAAAVVAVATLGVAWAPLQTGTSAWHVVAVCALALLPAAAALGPGPRRPLAVAAAAVAVLLGLALALRTSPFVLLFTPAGWREALVLLPDGLVEASSTNLPIVPAELPALAALLDLALLGLAGAAAWQAAARRTPVGAVVAVGAGLAYRWTVLPPEEPVLAGTLAFAAVLGILALLGAPRGGGRPAQRAVAVVVLGVLAATAALVVGSGPARAGGAWLDWTSWEVGDRSDESAAALDLEQSYGQLDWSDQPRVVMRITAEERNHMKAASLESFDGVAFGLDYPSFYERLSIVRGRIYPPTPSQDAARRERVGVELAAARTNLLLSPGRPELFEGSLSGEADLLGDSVRIEPPLERGDTYAVDAWIPDVGPEELLDAPPLSATLPEDLTQVRAGPGGASIDVPLWGSGLERPDSSEFGPYAEVADIAERVAGSARTQYAAVNRVEAYLRRNYVYDERPPYQATGAMPITWFLTASRRGFCQHFAGSMALMLRTLGIPARVAVGYTGGRYDPAADEWVVVDRDAHSWVEVYFEDYGWISFDPTPGRAVSTPASVSSPDYAPLQSVAETEGVEEAAVDPPDRSDAQGRQEEQAAPPGETPDDPSAGTGAGRSPVWVVLAVGLGAMLLLAAGPVLRAARRAGRRFGGDERERVLGAMRDLEEELTRLGLAPPPSGTAAERAAALRARTGVDAERLHAMASAARYAAGPPATGQADLAWREHARIRREVRRTVPWRRRLVAALPARRGRGRRDATGVRPQPRGAGTLHA